MAEVWKAVKGYEGLYRVSNFGRVFSIKNRKLLKPFISGNYEHVNLYKGGKRWHTKVHSLVANAFVANPENKPEINHIDGDKTNNRRDNLEWVTSSENKQHAIEHELFKQRPVIATNIESGEEIRFKSGREAARSLNVNQTSMRYVLNGRQKQSGGYRFRYESEVPRWEEN